MPRTEEDWEAPPPVDRKPLILSLLGLGLLLVWLAFDLRTYARRETRPMTAEEALHWEIAESYRAASENASLLDLAPGLGYPPYPPLYHWSLAKARGSSSSPWEALRLNVVYLAVLSLSLFAIAHHFMPAASSGLIAVVLLAGSPAVRHLSTSLLIELPLAACVAAAYWALLASDGFKNWLGSLVFGAVFALGMMHHFSFFCYLIPAYIIGFNALLERSSRPKALSAALVALGGFIPWYYAHLPLLALRFVRMEGLAAPRLPWALYAPLVRIADGFGPLLGAMGLLGMALPFYQRDQARGWFVPAWFMSCYALWLVLPQKAWPLLVPASFAGLAVAAACGSFPKFLLWTAALFQLFAGANYSAGWIRALHLPLPRHSLPLLVSRPLLAQDWKITEILRLAQSRHDAGRSFLSLVVSADDAYFNEASFRHAAKALAPANVSVIRRDSPFRDMARFVVSKKGALEPPGFQRIYESVGRWPLPDDSEAILYQQRRWEKVPSKGKSSFYAFYSTGAFRASDLRIDLGEWDPAAGVYPRASFNAKQVESSSFALAKIGLEVEKLLVIPGRRNEDLTAWDDARWLQAGKIKVQSLEMTESDVKRLLESRVRGLSISRLKLDKTVAISALMKSLAFSLEADVTVEQNPRRLAVVLREARIGTTAIPTGAVKSLSIPLEANPYIPFDVEIAGLRFVDGRLVVP